MKTISLLARVLKVHDLSLSEKLQAFQKLRLVSHLLGPLEDYWIQFSNTIALEDRMPLLQIQLLAGHQIIELPLRKK